VTATIFEALGGWRLEPAAKALLCQRAENRFVGVNCGILDQYTSCAGKEGCALLLDCRNLSSRPVRIDDTVRIVICDTRSRRELTGSEYGTRRSQCEEGAKLMGARALREVTLDRFAAEEGRLPAAVAKRCRFIIEEDDRVPRIAEALSEGDRDAIRELAAGSYRGACELFEIGAPSMESMMRAMLESPGTIGARQAGAGFGGCMVAFVEAPRVDDFARGVRERYHAATDIRPEVYPVMPAGGAGLL
jgi:galactokinase